MDYKKDFSVFMAKSHMDKSLKSECGMPAWIVPVQAGRSCTDIKIAELSDDTGDNISEKNPDFCELTVTYWVWKNVVCRYKGVCHYRRRMLLKDEDITNIFQGNVDMILPLPYICYPNATGQYMRYISKEDRKHLETALAYVSPESVDVLHEIDGQQIYYDFNMVIAKNDVFDDYADWMFSILFEAEKSCVPDGKIRGDRYAGYLGELLTTIYIFKNRDRLKIVHGERDWLV